MSDGREQSYYEIALTNRQVMSIFVVLLLCLLTAFVSGVWIGKEGGGGSVQTAEAQIITTGLRNTDQPLEQMDFFDPPAGGESATPQPAPVVETPPAAEEEVAPDEPKTVEQTPRAQRKAERAAKRAEPRPAEPEVVSTQREVFGEPVAAETEPTTAPGEGDSQLGEIFFIQVFSSNDEPQALSVVDRLRKGSYPALLSSADIEGRMMYRVRIGPYAERDQAQKVAQRVQQEYKLSTWITR